MQSQCKSVTYKSRPCKNNAGVDGYCIHHSDKKVADPKLTVCNFSNEHFKCPAYSKDLNGFCRRHINWYKRHGKSLPILTEPTTLVEPNNDVILNDQDSQLVKSLRALDRDTLTLLKLWSTLPPQRQEAIVRKLF